MAAEPDLNAMFRALCAGAEQIGWHPIDADHPAFEIYGDEGRELAERINRIGVRLYLAGEPGFESFGQLVADMDMRALLAPFGLAHQQAAVRATLARLMRSESR